MKLGEHQEQSKLRLLCVGESGSGKTRSLASLVLAGYKLRILDVDNGVNSIATSLQFVEKGKKRSNAAELLNMVDVETASDTPKLIGNKVVMRQAQAFASCMKILTEWSKEANFDEYPPDKTFIVIDTLSRLGQLAFNQAVSIAPDVKDRRQHYNSAQEMCRNLLFLLLSEEFPYHVILNTHITNLEVEEGVFKGVPKIIGQALSVDVMGFVNNVFMYQTKGGATNRKFEINTVGNSMMGCKNDAPLSLQPTYDAIDGLAKIVETLKGTIHD